MTDQRRPPQRANDPSQTDGTAPPTPQDRPPEPKVPAPPFPQPVEKAVLPVDPKADEAPVAATDDVHSDAELFRMDEERRFKVYTAQRDRYNEGARSAYSDFHKGLVGVIGGVILLSFTSLKDIGHAPESLPYLLGSWASLVVAGASALIGLLTSATADRERMAQHRQPPRTLVTSLPGPTSHRSALTQRWC